MDGSRPAEHRDRNAPAESSRAPLPLGKAIVFSLVPLAVLVSILEIAAWIADHHLDFRDRLLEAYGLMTVENRPIAPDEGFSFRSGIRIRSPSAKRADGEPYESGGRTIEGADASTSKEATWVDADDVVRAGEKRVFVIGGSAAFGFPYPYEDTFAAMLEEQLGTPWRVLNASRVGRTSGQLVRTAERIVESYAPDALVIYSGNNEWIRWIPSQQPRVSQTRIRAVRPLLHSRALSAVLYWTLKRASQRTGDPTAFRIHQEIAGVTYALRFPADAQSFDPEQWRTTRRDYLDAFEANLLRMIEPAQAEGVRVILMTVPFNYKLSPAWKHPQPQFFVAEHAEATREAIREAASFLEQRRSRDALRVTEAALERDAGPAVLHHLKAMSLEALERLDEAEAAYALSREAMIGNLGSRLSINESIEKVARESGVELLDLAALFDREQHALGGRFNEDLIHDDCHPTPLGNRLIAAALYQRLTTSQTRAH